MRHDLRLIGGHVIDSASGVDAAGKSMEGPKRWTPRLTVRAGRVWWRRWPSGGRE